MSEKIDTLDLIIQYLEGYEKRIDQQITRIEELVDSIEDKIQATQEPHYKCGYPRNHPPFPTCCTLVNGSRCQLEALNQKSP